MNHPLLQRCAHCGRDRLVTTPPAEAVTGAMVAVARDAHRAAMLATNGDRVAAMRAAITAALAAKEQP